jgi:hypothetical protein
MGSRLRGNDNVCTMSSYKLSYMGSRLRRNDKVRAVSGYKFSYFVIPALITTHSTNFVIPAFVTTHGTKQTLSFPRRREPIHVPLPNAGLYLKAQEKNTQISYFLNISFASLPHWDGFPPSRE